MGSLKEMLTAELSPYNNHRAHRIVLNGPAVELSADLAVPTGMAIHELTTNAAKYGALSVPEGSVRVSWDLVVNGEGKILRLEWTERGGPDVENSEAQRVRLDAASACPDNPVQRGRTLRLRS